METLSKRLHSLESRSLQRECIPSVSDVHEDVHYGGHVWLGLQPALYAQCGTSRTYSGTRRAY